MKYKKFSELDSVDNLNDTDLFAVSSTKNGENNFESNKVTFGQLKEQLDYDFDVVEVIEVAPPPEDDETVYILINGYRVAATRAKEEIRDVYPTVMPRILPAVMGFMASKGRLYTIPFTVNNLTLSHLSIEADTTYFSTLEVVKLDESSGYINLVTNLDATGNYSSIVTLTDELSGISTSIMIYHSRLINSLLNTSVVVSGNKITAKWRRSDITGNGAGYYGVITPKFTLSEAIDFKVYYAADYFNQANIHKINGSYVEFQVTILLQEPFSGDLVISFEDFNQGAGGMAIASVDYQG